MRVLVGYDLTVVDSYWLDTSAVGVRNKAVPIQHLQAPGLQRTSADSVKIILRLFIVVGWPQKMHMELLLYHVPSLMNRSAENKELIDFIGRLAGLQAG